MRPRDDQDDGQRRQFRRREDSHNANQAQRLGVLERLLLKHESWFEDMGVGNMSLEQRNALPSTLERTLEMRKERNRWGRRTAGLVGLAGFVGAVIAPILEKVFLH